MNNNLKDKNAAFVNLKDNDITYAYVKEIMKYKPLTAKQEKALFEKVELGKIAEEEIKNGSVDKKDMPEYEKMVSEAANAREEIILKNQRFVYATAKRYAQDDELLPDLLSEGNLGLLTAFDTYDIHSGNRFCTYAVWYIRRSINAYITTGSMMINKSNNTKTLSKLNKIQDKFFAEEGRFPTNQEVADILKDEYGIVIKNEVDLYDLKIDSINTCYDDEDDRVFENSRTFVSHASVSTDDMENVDKDYADRTIQYLIKYLDEREAKIISLVYGLNEDGIDYSIDEVASMIGITAQRVGQIRNNAIKKMKAHADEVNAF